MEKYDSHKLYSIIKSDRVVQSLIILLLVFIILISVFFGTLNGLSALFSYVFGILAFHAVLRYDPEIKRISSFFSRGDKTGKPNSPIQVNCNVCGDLNCDREKVVHKQKLWSGLTIPIEIDEALEKLLEKTLDEYIGSWYSNVSPDIGFPKEIRLSIQHAAGVVLSRALKVDIASLITTKLVPAAIKNFERCSQSNVEVLTTFHPALFSAQAEMDYLRLRVRELLPCLVEERSLKSSMFCSLVVEILAGWLLLPLSRTSDPAIMNSLLLILMSDKQLSDYPQTSQEYVPFLEAFVKKDNHLETNSHALHPDLCTVLKDQSLLYAFMQFLKDQGAVHILQFCLDVEEFNKRMLIPDLSSEQLDALYKDAWDLFSLYFSPHSPDSIGFAADLVVQMRKVLSKDVSKLRTSRPLFQAYEHAYSLLDTTYCPLFHTSDEFYTWLCGPRTPCSYNISGSSSPSMPGSPAKNSRSLERRGSRLSSRLHKIKGALKHQTVLDGTLLDTDPLQIESDPEYAEDLTLMEDEEEERDLSCWKVKIKDVFYKMDPTSGKLGPVYVIAVQRISSTEGLPINEWYVERRLADFYSLESKLTEFHGDFPDSQLPPCGLLAPSPPTEPAVYEAYLQKLLSNPSLRGSELLHWFLSAPEFTLPDTALGRLLRIRAPLSLRKERGQNIEPFIAAFIASTDVKPKTKLEWKEYSCEVPVRSRRCLTSSVFEDLLSLPLSKFPLPTSRVQAHPPLHVVALSGPADLIIYLGARLLRLPRFLMRIALSMHSLLKKPIDTYCNYYIDSKLRAILIPKRIAYLINLLQWVLYEKQTRTDPEEVSLSVQNKIKTLRGFSRPFYETVFESLKNPILNKQLFYTLFDVVLEELFPETKV